MNTAATSLPVTAVPSPAPTEIPMQIVGYSEDGTQALFSDAFGTVPPLLVTPAPAKRRMSTLEILLIAVAVAVGVVTLCLLISVSKK